MQTITRVGYALFSVSNIDKCAHNKYQEVTQLFSKCYHHLLSYFRTSDIDDKQTFIAASVEYDEARRFSACFYKGSLFFGFIDKATNQISFDDKTQRLLQVNPDIFLHLECKMEHAISAHCNQKTILSEKYVLSIWEGVLPLLNKIVAFEERINQLPEKKQSILRSSLLYDTFIDKIIEGGCNPNPTLDHEIDMLFGWLLAGGIHTLETINQGSVENNSHDEYEEKE